MYNVYRKTAIRKTTCVSTCTHHGVDPYARIYVQCTYMHVHTCVRYFHLWNFPYSKSSIKQKNLTAWKF